jgi:type II secretory pathway component GspD/PulD (secretin)
MRVVTLQHASALEIADELNRLAAPGIGAGPDVEPAYTLVADARSNSVIVKSSPADLEHVLEIIGELDQKAETKPH